MYNSLFRNIPPVTKNLIIINFLIWLAMMILPSKIDVDFMRYGALHYFTAPDFNPMQLVTYMFMHSTATFAHLFFNMFTLWMFGVTLERVMGSARFLFFYITVGIGAALVQELVWALTFEPAMIAWISKASGAAIDIVQQAYDNSQLGEWEKFYLNNAMLTLGASGAIYGILLAFGMLFPNRRMFLMFIPVPVKAKWMIIGFFAIELLLGIWANDSVAHFAHLGGMIVAFPLIWYWKKKGIIYGDPF